MSFNARELRLAFELEKTLSEQLRKLKMIIQIHIADLHSSSLSSAHELDLHMYINSLRYVAINSSLPC